MASPSPTAPVVRLLPWITFGWVVAGALLAHHVPWLSLMPGVGLMNALAPVVTVVLIVVNLRSALRTLSRTADPVACLADTLLQVVLFTLLFFQIGSHLGASHFDLDRSPRWTDWLTFSAAHAVRVTDVLDLLEAYGLKIQAVQHSSILITIALVAYHLIVGVFVLSLLALAWNRVSRGLREDPEVGGKVRKVGLYVFIGWAVALPISALFVRPWAGRDIPLWFLDNVLRIIDFADLMDLFQVRLHQVPKHPWENTLTALCRVFLVVLVGNHLDRLAARLSLRFLNGFGLTRRELTELRADPTATRLYPLIDARLARLDPVDARGWRAADWMAAVLAAGAFAAVGPLAPGWLGSRTEAVGWLVREAESTRSGRAGWALLGLRRMGKEAAPAVEPLTRLAYTGDTDRRVDVVQTLGFLGEDAIDPLVAFATTASDPVNKVAVEALVRIGPDAAPGLVRVAAHSTTRREADRALEAFGTRAVEPLMNATTPENLVTHFTWCRRLDRNFLLRSTSNSVMADAMAVYPRLSGLVADLTGTDGRRRNQAAEELMGLSATSALALPMIQEQMSRIQKPESQLEVGRVMAQMARKTGNAALLTPLLESKLHRMASIVIGTYGQPGEGNEAVVRQLMVWLDTPRYSSSAAGALSRFGAAAAPALPKLIAYAASTPYDKERYQMEKTLQGIDPNWTSSEAARQAVPLILRRLQETGSSAAGSMLDRIDPKWKDSPAVKAMVPELAAWVKVGGEDRKRALTILKLLGPAGAPAAGELATCLTEGVLFDRILIADLLAGMGPGASAAAPALVARLNWSTPLVRSHAEKALAGIGTGAMPALIAALPTASSKVPESDVEGKVLVLKLLGRIGPGAAPAADRILFCLGEPYSTLLDAAAHSLGRMGKAVVPRLITVLDDPNEHIRRVAIRALAAIGRDAAAARPKLLILQSDTDDFTALEARKAIMRIGNVASATDSSGTNEAVAALAMRLKASEPHVRLAAAQALGAMGTEARPAAPALVAALSDGVVKVRLAVAIAVAKVGVTPKEVPQLIELMADRVVDHHAATLAAKVGPEAVPALVGALKHPNQEVQKNAAKALGLMGPAAKAAVPQLIARLKERGRLIHPEVVSTLGRIGPDARDAIPALEKIRDFLALDKAPSTAERQYRRDVEEALGKIRGTK